MKIERYNDKTKQFESTVLKSVKEWSVAKKYNPFNSYKLISQVYRWRNIKRGNKLYPPCLVTIDPNNSCDLDCIWCNSEYILKRRHQHLSKRALLEIAEFLGDWKVDNFGVEAVCVAGGGESLLNPATYDLIERLIKKGIQVGIVTNGVQMNKHYDTLSKCTWVGVSVDAGTPETFQKIKGKDKFQQVIDNMQNLIQYANDNDTTLGIKRQGNGVTYKYLLHPYNVGEVEKSVKLAHDIGCRNFHLRPMGVPWDKLSNDNDVFTTKSIETYASQLEDARRYETSDFGVFTVSHKFDEKLRISNIFRQCYAVFMTCAIMPSTIDRDQCTVGLCCDRRGDKRLELLTNGNINQLAKLWGSKKHWDIFDNINLKDCPRCTYQPHNQIFEHVILDDSMTYRFI